MRGRRLELPQRFVGDLFSFWQADSSSTNFLKAFSASVWLLYSPFWQRFFTSARILLIARRQLGFLPALSWRAKRSRYSVRLSIARSLTPYPAMILCAGRISKVSTNRFYTAAPLATKDVHKHGDYRKNQ
jgi:hypothetical protein